MSNRDSEHYRRGYSEGKRSASVLFRIGSVRNALENARLSRRLGADDEGETDYWTGVIDALKVRENQLRRVWEGGQG